LLRQAVWFTDRMLSVRLSTVLLARGFLQNYRSVCPGCAGRFVRG